MSLIWSPEHRSAICRHSEQGYPNEVCGLLIGERVGADKIVREVLPEENVWEAPDEQRRRFQIGADVIAREERRLRGTGRAILGFYHSHPDHEARPSETDREHAWPTYSYVIQTVRQGVALTVASWVLNDDRTGYREEPIVARDAGTE